MASHLDFRNLDEGLGGQKKNKRKRVASTDEEADGEEDAGHAIAMDVEETEEALRPAPKRAAIAAEGESRPSFGRPTYDGTLAGKVSGRKWKQAKTARASSIKVSHKRPSLEQRTRQKEIKKAYLERKAELKEQIRLNKVTKRKLKEERDKRKQENVLRTGTVYQKITNPNKLKKMSKKQRKSLKVVPE